MTSAIKRNFSASANHDEAAEAAKWEKIAYVGIASCTILSIYNLAKGIPIMILLLRTHTCTFATRSFHGNICFDLGPRSHRKEYKS